jgi:hypothetical protein
MFTGPRAAIRWAAPIFLVTAGSAVAEPTYSIDAFISDPAGEQSVVASQVGPFMTGRSNSTGFTGAAVSVAFGAIAKPGVLGSSSSASALAPGASIGGGAGSIVGFDLDNLKILDPGLATGTRVDYTINFEIGGKLAASAFGLSEANAGVGLTYNGVVLGTAAASTVPGATFATGIFSAGLSDVKTHTPMESGLIGDTAIANFLLSTNATASAGPAPNESGQASALADFLDPFSFPTNGPVFNFFDANGNPLTGVTVDSTDGCIVNNRFVCGGGAGGGGTQVPEPATWTMLLLGFATLGYSGRHRGDTRRTGGRRPAHKCTKATRSAPAEPMTVSAQLASTASRCFRVSVSSMMYLLVRRYTDRVSSRWKKRGCLGVYATLSEQLTT